MAREIRIVDSINEADPGAWDALAGNRPQVAFGWLRTLEECQRSTARPKYVLVSDSNRLVAAATCYLDERRGGEGRIDELLLGRISGSAQRLGLSFLPAVVCGQLVGYATPLLVDRDRPALDRERLLAELVDAIEAFAGARRLPVCYRAVREDERSLSELLVRRGYHRTPVLWISRLDVQWRSFEGYLDSIGSFSRNMRANIRKEIGKNSRAGVVIEPILDPSSIEDRLHDLVDRHHQRLNGKPFLLTKGVFGRLKANLGKDAIICGAFKNAELVAVCATLCRGDVQDVTMLGVDQASCADDTTYFNLGYYQPIRHAIESGVRQLWFGAGLEKTKARRGCVRVRAHLYHHASSRARNLALTPWFRLHAAWMGRKGSAKDRRVFGKD